MPAPRLRENGGCAVDTVSRPFLLVTSPMDADSTSQPRRLHLAVLEHELHPRAGVETYHMNLRLETQFIDQERLFKGGMER